MAINPVDIDARVDMIASKVVEAGGGVLKSDPGIMAPLAAGLRLSPGDARLYSLVGIVEEQSGNRPAAAEAFSHALELAPTEVQALIHGLRYAIEDGRLAEATDHLEMIGRRWPRHWSHVEPVLPVLLADRAAFDAIAQRFRAPDLRRLLIGSTAKTPQTLGFGYRLLTTWHGQGVAGLDDLINQITGAFIRQQRYSEAFLLFRLTRDETADTGLVYNGGFDQPVSGNPFDWRLTRQAGVDLAIAPRRTASGEVESVLAIRFLDNPIRFANVSQMVRLAPGQYRLAIAYSARELRAPKPLKFSVACVESGARIGAGLFEYGTLASAELSFDFTVPPTRCSLQRLLVYNENLTESWKNRYAGTLYLHRVAIALIGS